MKGEIDGTEVYLDEGQLPAFTLSVNSVLDPSKVQGTSSTTLRLIATKETRRMLGGERMAEVALSERPTLRIGDDSVDLFRSAIIAVRKDRDLVECIAVGGNAAWFEQARSTKLHSLNMGISAPLDAALQIATWDDDESALYFPVVDFGSFEGRLSTYDVPVDALRPAIRVHTVIDKAMSSFGFRFLPMGRLSEAWKKIVVLEPKAKASISIPGPYPTTEDFTTSNPAPDGYYFIPSADGVMDVECYQLEMNLNPALTDWDAMQFRLVVYDFTSRQRLAIYDIPLVYFGDADYAAMRIDHTFTGVEVTSGHEIYVAIECLDIDEPTAVPVVSDAGHIEYDRDSGTQVLKLRPGNGVNLYALMPVGAIGAYYEGYQLDIAKVCPDWTVAQLITALSNALCLTFTTDESSGIIRAWFDNEYFRKPNDVAPFRDWTDRMDHTQAPAIISPEVSRRLVLKYENDEDDRFMVMANRRSGAEFGYGSYVQVNPEGYVAERTITVPFSPTINSLLFEGCMCPIMRKVDGTFQEDSYDAKPRIFIADGLATGDWELDSVPQTEYPKCYFSAADTPLPLAFDNAVFDGTVHPLSKDRAWSRRLREQQGRILEAFLFIRDHELRNFDFGMPTLIDDGSGPSWWWVQEIKQHRFGIHQPTKCVLVRIPTAEVEIEEVTQPAVSYPEQPFLCVGPGYVSFIISSGGTGSVSMTTNSGYFTVREPNGDYIVVSSYTLVGGLGPGGHCVWASDSEGKKVVGPSITYFGIGIGDFDEIILDGLENEPVYNITIIEADTLTTITIPAIAALTSLDIQGSSDLEEIVITDAGSLNVLLLSANALTEACVDAIAVEIESGSVSGGTLNMDGGTSSAPSATGAAAIATLEALPNMSISGTGNANVDGDYNDDGTQNGKSRYIHASNGITEVYWTGAQWRILAVDAIYDSYDAVAQPWLATTWILVSGTASLPTVNAPGRGWTVTTN